jgi:hypothetical protein
LTELTDTEIALVAGGQDPVPPPPTGGGVVTTPAPPPTGGGLASLGSDFSKLYADLRGGASFSTIRADYHTILHDAGVGGF